MNLLPKAKAEFSETSYWENFFKKRGTKAFDWYGEYPELCTLLNKYVKPKDDILVIGCGNSTLSASMYDVGYRNIKNIDTSAVVIKQMQDANSKIRPDLIFEKRDALDTKYSDNQFSVVLDKGTLDALMPDSEEKTLEQINALFKEIDRILRVGGRYICVSLLQPHILQHLLQKFPIPAPEGFGWPFRICLCSEASVANLQLNTAGPTMPVFFVVCTKFKAMPGMPSIVEMSLSEQHVMRIGPEEIKTQVISLHEAALVTWKLRSQKQTPGSGNQEEADLSIQLHKPGEDNPRYTIKVVDRSSVSKGAAHKFVAFVVPQGRETEYLFATADGQKEVISMTGADRLALIYLHRGQKYESLDVVKEELASSIVQLAPAGMSSNAQIPFLSTGSDTGHREVIFEGHSEFSGDFVVEDVDSDKDKFRRLIFLANQAVVQSEALLRSTKSNKSKKGNFNVDVTFLACDHHRLMSMGLALFAKPLVLLIGLGGGGLCTFLSRCFPTSIVTAVEIDCEMLSVAQTYFGLTLSERLKVEIQDGLQFIKNSLSTGSKFSVVMFDVDNKDTSLGMSCPPKEFVSEDVIANVKNILSDDGVFILNLVCRDAKLKKKTLEDLRKSFTSIASVPLEEEVNEVVFCSTSKSAAEMKKWVKDSATKANIFAKKAKAKDELLNVTELCSHLSIQ